MNTASAADPDFVQVACPSCHSLVRVPKARLGDSPKCPRCKSMVLASEPFALESPSFDQHATRGTFPLLVDFWAAWCGPCRMMEPVLERLAGEWSTRLQLGKVDTDEQQELAVRFGIRSIPTLILFSGGKEIARQSGALDYGSLTRWLEQSLGKSGG